MKCFHNSNERCDDSIVMECFHHSNEKREIVG
jgi:hypothetical protein